MGTLEVTYSRKYLDENLELSDLVEELNKLNFIVT